MIHSLVSNQILKKTMKIVIKYKWSNLGNFPAQWEDKFILNSVKFFENICDVYLVLYSNILTQSNIELLKYRKYANFRKSIKIRTDRISRALFVFRQRRQRQYCYNWFSNFYQRPWTLSNWIIVKIMLWKAWPWWWWKY